MQKLVIIVLSILSVLGRVISQGNPPLCDPGATEWFDPITIEFYCEWCPAGTEGYEYTNGYNLCENCDAGYYQPDIGQTSCLECSAAYYSSAGSSTCSTCPAGTVAPNAGSSSCTECPAGTFQGLPQTFCGGCTYGTYSLPGTSGAENCISCPVNTYCPMFGCPTCLSCPFASYTTTTGNAVCTNCSVDSSAVSGCQGGAIVAVNFTNQASNSMAVYPSTWSPQVSSYTVSVSGSTSTTFSLILQAPPGTTISNYYVFQWGLTCSPSCGTYAGTKYIFNTNYANITLATLSIPASPGPFSLSLDLSGSYYSFSFSF
jgi:Tyrosine-protein kinase ephrin type A/B receptor-like